MSRPGEGVQGAARARLGCAVLALAAVFLISGCRHQQTAISAQPPVLLPPGPSAAPVASATGVSGAPSSGQSAAVQPLLDNPGVTTAADLAYVASHAPLYTETGTASWYGPPYNKRRGANGQIFDQDAMTAAHRTLPLNSLVRVTNTTTGAQAVMHVTDRGPFVPNRVLDLSLASAKALGVYRPGLALVRIDVFAVPSPIATGGRWCVQVGAFQHASEADKLRDHLSRKYQTANVIEFTGPTGHWVRIRPLKDDKDRAVEIARELSPAEGSAYLVRLD